MADAPSDWAGDERVVLQLDDVSWRGIGLGFGTIVIDFQSLTE